MGSVDQSPLRSKFPVQSEWTLCVDNGSTETIVVPVVSVVDPTTVLVVSSDMTKEWGQTTITSTPHVQTQRIGGEVKRHRSQTPGRQVAAPTPDPMMTTIYGKSRSGT